MDILPLPSHARDHVAAAYGAGAAAAVCNAADASHAGTAARHTLGSTRRTPARAAPPHERAAPPHLCPPSRQPHLRPGLRPHLCSSVRPRPHLQLTRPRGHYPESSTRSARPSATHTANNTSYTQQAYAQQSYPGGCQGAQPRAQGNYAPPSGYGSYYAPEYVAPPIPPAWSDS